MIPLWCFESHPFLKKVLRFGSVLWVGDPIAEEYGHQFNCHGLSKAPPAPAPPPPPKMLLGRSQLGDVWEAPKEAKQLDAFWTFEVGSGGVPISSGDLQ